MKTPRPIPEELIKFKAHQIWKKRLREGKEGTSESDWIKAKRHLEKHRWKVFLWRLGEIFKKVWGLVREKARI